MLGNGGKCKEGSESVKACLDLLGAGFWSFCIGGSVGDFSRYEIGAARNLQGYVVCVGGGRRSAVFVFSNGTIFKNAFKDTVVFNPCEGHSFKNVNVSKKIYCKKHFKDEGEEDYANHYRLYSGNGRMAESA